MFKEPSLNTAGTDYIAENYSKLEDYVKRLGITEKFDDLIHDCYMCMRKKELDGLGFKSDDALDNNVGNYVYGTLRKYAKNIMYKNGVVEVKRHGAEIVGITYCGSCDEDGEREGGESRLDCFQEAYRIASCYGDFEDVDTIASVRDQLDFVINFETSSVINLKCLFQNLDELQNMKFDKGVFAELKNMIEYHDEFRDAFNSVLEFRKANREAFDELLAAV